MSRYFVRNYVARLSENMSSAGEHQNGSQQYIITIPFQNSGHRYDTRGLGWNFYEAMKKYENRIAQIDASTGETQTYGNLLKQCVRLAINMKIKAGIGKGDTISICSCSRIEQQVVFVAAQFLGARIAPLDSRMWNLGELEVLNSKLVFADESGVDSLEKNGAKSTNVVAFDSKNGRPTYEEFLQPTRNGDEENFHPVEIEDEKEVAVILFTSGSSGAPKGVYLSHYSLIRKMYNFSTVPERVIHFTPLTWISGVNMLISTVTGGSCKVVSADFDPSGVYDLIARHGIEVMFVSTVQATSMSKTGRPADVDVSALKKLLVGGSNLSERIYKELRDLLPEVEVYNGYGLTETCGALLFFDGKMENLGSSPDKPLTCGRPIPGNSYKVADPETGKALGPNQIGELRIKSDMIFNGYFDPEATKEAFDGDGWLKTGDLIYYDENHYFYVVDRIKEIYKYGVWTVAPSVVENLLQTHPAVERCVVIPVPHEDDISHALGVVMLKRSHRNTKPDELLRFVDERVDEKYRLKAGVKIVDSIPLNATDKIDKKRVKEEILRQYSKK